MGLSLLVAITSLCLPLFFYKYQFKAKVSHRESALYIVNYICKYIFPVVLISLLWGLRYDVGKDYLSYKEIYETSFGGTFGESLFESNVEYLYAFISYVLFHLNVPYYGMFIVMALIPLFFYYAAFEDKPFIFGYSLFFLMALGVVFWYFNIQRQGITFFILLYAVKFIKDKKFFYYMLCLILATGFHYSALLFLPCYLFAYMKPTLGRRKNLFILAYVLTWILASPLQYVLLKIISTLLVGKYAIYVDIINVWNMESTTGIGLLLIHVVDLLIIFVSPLMCRYFQEYRYDIYFRIFFIGVLFSNIAGLNMVLSRFPFCFVSMRIVLLAFFFFYIQRNWRVVSFSNRIIWVISLIITNTLLVANIFHNPYKFIESL